MAITEQSAKQDGVSQAERELPAVLIVDDIEANLKVLGALLDRLPCTVTSVSSGSQALSALLQRDFAVMLLDVEMPEMDGYEVAQAARLNAATRDVPIIFVTAQYGSDVNIARGYGSGAVDVLFKPIDSVILLSKVRIFLELYLGRQQVQAKNLELRALANAEAKVALDLRRANDQLQIAYDDLQAAQTHLVQSAKMASLGELVAGIAHEINNPLAFVLSHLDTARKNLDGFHRAVRTDLQPEAEEQWQRARTRLAETEIGLARIRDLVLQLRTFSRLDEGERKVVSIRECIEAVLTILGHRLKDRIQVITEFGHPDTIECYPGPINQVLLNLVANAIDAVDGDGTISIHAGPERGEFVIKVGDTGPGIAADLRERVLEPFFTTKPVGQGTGLGLSIAYSIIKKHNGTLTIETGTGGGALIAIRIPLRPPT